VNLLEPRRVDRLGRARRGRGRGDEGTNGDVLHETHSIVLDRPRDTFRTLTTSLAPNHCTFGCGSLQPADLTVDGRPATAATLLDPDTVRFTLPVTENGRHVLRLPAGALSAASGAPVREYFGEYVVHLAAPRVVSTSLAQGAEQLPGPLSLDVRFDRPLTAAGLDPSDFAFVARDTGATRTPSAWSYDPQTTTLHVEYPAQSGDHYALVLYSGNGRFEGVDGGELDGEGAALPSDDGAAGGSFVLNFALQQPAATAAPSNLVAYSISGSEIELAWRDNSTNERGFRVDRAAGDGEFVELATLGPNATRYNDTSALPGSYYRYRVRAFVVAGPSAWSDPFTATVLPPELTTPVKQFAPLPEVSTPLEADPTAVLTVAPGLGVFVAKDGSSRKTARSTTCNTPTSRSGAPAARRAAPRCSRTSAAPASTRRSASPGAPRSSPTTNPSPTPSPSGRATAPPPAPSR
jgi:hypothetical protein